MLRSDKAPDGPPIKRGAKPEEKCLLVTPYGLVSGARARAKKKFNIYVLGDAVVFGMGILAGKN
jgi:hypothetical protein